MKALLFITLLLAVSVSAQETVGLPKECKKEVDVVAADVVKVITDFQGDFEMMTFIKDAMALYHQGESLKEVCEGNVWEAVLEVVLESLEEEVHGCALKVVTSIQDAFELYELFQQGHKPSYLAIIRKATHLINSVKSAISECSGKEVMADLDNIEAELNGKCVVTLFQEVPKILKEFKAQAWLKLIPEALKIKKACF